MERDLYQWKAIFVFLFQLTRSRGAWPPESDMKMVLLSFQLTRSRGAWRHFLRTECRSKISTHTLTWSVTDTTFVKCVVWGISTHTLTWSVTLLLIVFSFALVHFNSHAHVERDCRTFRKVQTRCIFQLTRSRGAWHDVDRQEQEDYTISTHTLTWSVTTA